MTDPTPLSSAAQAVLATYEKVWGQGYGSPLAAALRAAADQVVPQRLEIYRDEAERIDGNVRSDVRNDFFAIADELEAQ